MNAVLEACAFVLATLAILLIARASLTLVDTTMPAHARISPAGAPPARNPSAVRSFAAAGAGLRVEPEDRVPIAFTSREQLGYWLLVRLQASGATEPQEYLRALPDFDEFELRGAANWLVVNGYATWASGSRIALTGQGRQVLESIDELTRR